MEHQHISEGITAKIEGAVGKLVIGLFKIKDIWFDHWTDIRIVPLSSFVKKYKSINQLQKLVIKAQAPDSILRFDKGNPDNFEKDHVHFNDGSALNKDGSWKHRRKELTNNEKKILKDAGWTLPKK